MPHQAARAATTDARGEARSTRLMLAGAGIGMAAPGFARLVGSRLRVPWAMHLHGGDVTAMPYAVAVALLLVGAGLLALASSRRRPAMLCGGLAGVVALLEGVGRLVGVPIGLGALFPGDQAASGATLLVLAAAGAGVAAGGWRGRRRLRGMLLGLLGIVLGVVGIVGLLVYLVDTAVHYALGSSPDVAVQDPLGFLVIGLAALALARSEAALRPRASLSWLPVVAAGCTAVAALGLSIALYAHEEVRAARATEVVLARVRDEVQLDLQTRLQALTGTARLWSFVGPPTPGRWTVEARRLIGQFAEFRAVAWMTPELKVRQVVSRPGHGEGWVSSRPGGGDSRYGAAWLEREAGGSVLVRGGEYPGLIRAREPRTSGTEFLLSAPIVRDGAFDGSMVAVMQLDAMLDGIWVEHAAGGYSIALFQGDDEIYRSWDGGSGRSGVWSSPARIDLAGTVLFLRVQPMPDGPAAPEDDLALAVLGGGLLLALALATAVHLAQAARRRAIEAERSNERLEREIAVRMQVEAQRLDLLAREQEARAAAEAGQRRAAFLAEASRQLAESLDYETTLARVARLVVSELADRCTVDLIEPDGSMRRVATAHRNPAKEELARSLTQYAPSPSGAHPKLKALQSGRSELVPEVTDALLVRIARNDDHLRIMREIGIRSYLGVPMLARGRALGAISFTMDESGRRYGPTELALAEELARRAALAVDNARLYRESQEAERRAALLARTSSELSRSLDYEGTLQGVAHLVVPEFADRCIVDLVEPDGTFRRVTVAHATPELAEQGGWLANHPPSADRPHPIAEVLRTGQSKLVPVVTDAWRRSFAADDAHFAKLKTLAHRSWLSVPLIARGRTLGALTFISVREERQFGQADLLLAEDLGRSAALAVDNARLYRDAQAAQQRFRDLVQGLDAIVWEAEPPDWRFTFVSQRAEEILGYPVGDWSASPDFWTARLLHLEDGDEVGTLGDLAERSGRSDHALEHRALTADGRTVWLRHVVRVVRDADGGPQRLRGITLDVTERRRVEEDLKSFAERLERSNRELQDFASVASHDLQEPLRKIRAFGDRLEAAYAAVLGEQGRDHLGRMLSAAGRMQTLINDLLTFARVTTKAQPFVPVRLADVARDVLSDLETRIEQTGGRVEVGDLPAIDADPMQMRQLLQNLIGNALKFHRPGEPPVVEVTGELLAGEPGQQNGHATPGGSCRITVSDNGIGFEEKYLDRIFAVFQRLHGRGTYEGTGMGLAICRKIAQRHGGDITARSEPGKGASFVITLPAMQPKGGRAQ